MADVDVPKLYYFKFAGYAEAVRLAFKVGGISYYDQRIEFSDWPALKPKTPNGKIPYMVLPDGSELFESIAIAKYAAKKGGLVPSDPVLEAQMDGVMLFVADIAAPFQPTFVLGEEEKKAARERLVQVVWPDRLPRLEAFITKIGSQGFCVGDKLSVADIHLTTIFTLLTSGYMPIDHVPTTLFDDYPRIKAVMATVMGLPAVKQHYEENPKGSGDAGLFTPST